MTNGRDLAFGAGCGAVSALLFAVISSGSSLALIVYLIAPLPLLIATLGFGYHAGLVAVLSSFVVTAFIFSAQVGISQLISIGLPSWFSAFLLILARPRAEGHANGDIEFYPLGNVLLWIIGVSGLLTLAGAWMLGGGTLTLAPDYNRFSATFTRAVEAILAYDPSLVTGLSTDADLQSMLAQVLSIIAMPISVSMSIVISVGLLWIAGRVVSASGRLPRPWPDLAMTALPRVAVPALLICLALAFVSRDYPALAGRIGVSALLTGYCLHGLAVLHAITRPLKSRRSLLFALYLVFILLPGWPIIGFALVGLADMWFSFRTRFSTTSLSPHT